MSVRSHNPVDPNSIKAKKRWGQNFLTDGNIRRKILDCAEVQPGESVLEIGPGKGFLTQGLLERGAKVTAVEIDSALVRIIRSKMEHPLNEQESRVYQNLTLIQDDALKYHFNNLDKPFKVVANLPYYISTPLLFRFLKERKHISRMVLMLQKEVAERITAKTGSKTYGALSVVLQFYADVRIEHTVSPHCFQPKPKVASAIISIRPLQKTRIHVRDEALFLKVVKGAFLYRRKRLRNALCCAGFHEPWVKAALQSAACDGDRRGETLEMSEFAALSDALDICIKGIPKEV